MTIIGKLKVDNIDTNTIYEPTEWKQIELIGTNIRFFCNSLTVNGENIITPGSNVVKNPLDADLNCNDNNLTTVGTITGVDIDTINSNLNATMSKRYTFKNPCH